MNYEEDLANWANLTEDRRHELMNEERELRPKDEAEEAAQRGAAFEACRHCFEAYLNTLGPFEVEAGHGHSINVTSEWAREDLIKSLAGNFAGWLQIWALPVAEHAIAQHKAGGTLRAHGTELRCHSCGARSHVVDLTGTKLKPLVYNMETRGGEKLELPDCPIDATQPYSVEIDIPSGEMIVANRLARLFDGIADKCAERNSLCHVWGRKNCTEAYARQGYIEMNIGNCGCYLFKTNNEGSKFVMGDHDSVKGRQVASVCTAFWGYGIADHEEAKRRGLAEKMKDQEYSIVKCVPGRYRFTHRYHLLRDGMADDGIYTYIEKV